MKKYIEPELLCRSFAAENIITTSNQEVSKPDQSAQTSVTNALDTDMGGKSNVMTADWSKGMSN